MNRWFLTRVSQAVRPQKAQTLGCESVGESRILWIHVQIWSMSGSSWGARADQSVRNGWRRSVQPLWSHTAKESQGAFWNFFCTIPLHQALRHQGIYGIGTCRRNRLHGAQLKLKSEKQVRKGGRRSLLSPMLRTSLPHVGLIVQWFTWPLPVQPVSIRCVPEIEQERRKMLNIHIIIIHAWKG